MLTDKSEPAAAPRLALRPKDAALALGISERLLWQLTKDDRIPHIRIGRAVVYPVSKLQDWLNAQAAESDTPVAAEMRQESAATG
jgi:predicted DNA-binding transcriptional regulator AlpA